MLVKSILIFLETFILMITIYLDTAYLYKKIQKRKFIVKNHCLIKRK